MTRAFTLICFIAMLGACATKPVCGNAPQARTVFFKNSCERRIDHVIVGADLKIPSNIKQDALANFDLIWSDPSVDGGQVTLGHYDLVPKGQAK